MVKEHTRLDVGDLNMFYTGFKSKPIHNPGLITSLIKDGDAIKLGDATHEGGDIKVYRDGSNNLQFSLDADAASNAKALDVYGGVVVQNFLTVGGSFNTAFPLYIYGAIRAYLGTLNADFGLAGINSGYGIVWDENATAGQLNIPVTDSADHAIQLQIDANNIIEVKATGDGAGGITNKAIGVFGVTPQVRQAHIADPTDLATCITALSTLLADMEGYGWLLDS